MSPNIKQKKYGRSGLCRKLASYVFFNSKEDTQPEEVIDIMQKWLSNHPEYIPLFLENADYILKRGRGALQGRKEARILKRNSSLL
jgi:hypothetical protein